MLSNHLIFCRPLLLPSIFPSIKVFSNELALWIKWPKYWSISFNISPSNEFSGFTYFRASLVAQLVKNLSAMQETWVRSLGWEDPISFRIDWFDLLAIQGTLKSLLQHHSSKASILQHSAFFIVQLSHPYMTTEKTIALTRWTFVGKVTSLLFNMLSMLVIAFLPRSKHLLISWLQSTYTVISKPPK